VRRLDHVSGGNPFYALELARALLRREDPHAGIDSLPLPDTLSGAVSERISALAPEARRALLTVSALSAPTHADVIAVVGGDAVARAADAHVIVLEPERVRLAHPLLGSVAYDSASAAERRELHAKLADIVENPEDRARHHACAAAAPDETVAAALEKAAHTARARAATDSAVELAEFAVALTPENDRLSRLRRVALAGVCHYGAGDAQRAHELLTQVVEALPAGLDRAQLLWRLGTVKTAIAGPPAAFALYTQALEEAQGDNRLRAQILDRLVVWRWVADGATQAEAHAQALLELAEEVGEPGLLARAIGTKLALEVAQGRPLDRQRYERMLEMEREDHDQGIELPGNILHLQLLTWAGELDESRARITQLLARARGRSEAAQLLPLWCLGWLDLVTANWQATIESAERGLELAEQIGRDAMVHPCLTLRALARAHLGDVDGAVSDARVGGEFTTRTGQEIHALGARTALALLDLSRGDTGAAHTAYAEIAGAMERRGDRCLGEWWLPDELEARVAEGDVDEADRRLELFARESERTGYPRFLAQTARCRGLIAFGRGDTDEALAQLAAATGFHEQCDDPYQQGRTLLALGTLLRRLGKKARAAETLADAERLFTISGAALWIERAIAERGRIGGRATASRALTETERQIADLVARGRSNAEVARALSISPRTVEWNLTKIFRKLRVTSRTELAAKLTAH
jgi:DNA-binding CsgD family transcriptional regulator